MITKNDIKQGQKWRKGIERKGLNLQGMNNPKIGKKQKGLTADQLYDYIVNGK